MVRNFVTYGCGFLLVSLGTYGQNDCLSYVDPLIGTINGGNVFPGATLPYGLAKAVADVDGQNTGGFGMDGSNVTGFSGLHDSGSGGNLPLATSLCSPSYA